MEVPKNLNIRNNADKIMFAEDFISYFMVSNGFSADFPKLITEDIRHDIFPVFSDVIKIAARFLYYRISVFNTFRSFENSNVINNDSFLLFTEILEAKYFWTGFNSQTFLYLCSYLAYMAISFYKKGVKEAPKLAVDNIIERIKMYNMIGYGYWNALTIVAVKYTKTAAECGFVEPSVFKSLKIQFISTLSENEDFTDSSDDYFSDDDNDEDFGKADIGKGEIHVLELLDEIGRRMSIESDDNFVHVDEKGRTKDKNPTEGLTEDIKLSELHMYKASHDNTWFSVNATMQRILKIKRGIEAIFKKKNDVLSESDEWEIVTASDDISDAEVYGDAHDYDVISGDDHDDLFDIDNSNNTEDEKLKLIEEEQSLFEEIKKILQNCGKSSLGGMNESFKESKTIVLQTNCDVNESDEFKDRPSKCRTDEKILQETKLIKSVVDVNRQNMSETAEGKYKPNDRDANRKKLSTVSTDLALKKIDQHFLDITCQSIENNIIIVKNADELNPTDNTRGEESTAAIIDVSSFEHSTEFVKREENIPEESCNIINQNVIQYATKKTTEKNNGTKKKQFTRKNNPSKYFDESEDESSLAEAVSDLRLSSIKKMKAPKTENSLKENTDELKSSCRSGEDVAPSIFNEQVSSSKCDQNVVSGENASPNITKGDLKVKEYSLFDDFIIDILENTHDLEIYGQTHNAFLEKEDHFNGAIDLAECVQFLEEYDKNNTK